ncbi:MAG: CehA/McbA family metallohydrolase [Thermoplasmata archaeon]|nr:CehA/McbA family metallohydrolase [Thermoplasmata archaeon]
MKLDLHIHSTFSADGTADPEKILQHCRDIGLGGCSITDHNSIEGSSKAAELGSEMGLVVVRGIEVSSSEGHILGYGLSAPVPRRLSMIETIAEIHNAGGIAVAAHPTRLGSGVGMDAAGHAGFDAVEVLNGGSSARGNRIASRLALDNQLPVVGGSDAHKVVEIGRSYTVVEGADTEADIIRAVVEGRSKACGRSRSWFEGVVCTAEANLDWARRGFRRL